MKRHALCLIVASLTFTVGILVASLRFGHGQRTTVDCSKALRQASTEPVVERLDFADIFRDFDFVGGSTIDADAPTHKTTEALPLPQTFETGNKYFFHLPGRGEQLSAFYVALRDRLRAHGLDSSFKPFPNGMGLVCLHTDFRTYYVKYPLAEVKFYGKEYEGRITMIPHPRSRVSDYVLVLEKRPQ